MSALSLTVPAYVHPSEDPAFWTRLEGLARRVRFVVVNVHDGPGEVLDPAYAPVVENLHAARVRTVGYVDTAYGERPAADVVAQARVWVERYGVRGVFFDQVAGDFEHLQYYSACSLGARAAGAQFVVLNPGTDCHPGYADLANVTVMFEGTWADHLTYETPAWTTSRPAGRFAHLVHGVPADQLAAGARRLRELHAGCGFLTPATGDNPWKLLPEELLADAAGVAFDGAPTLPAAPWPERRYVPAAPPERPRRPVRAGPTALLARAARVLAPDRTQARHRSAQHP